MISNTLPTFEVTFLPSLSCFILTGATLVISLSAATVDESIVVADVSVRGSAVSITCPSATSKTHAKADSGCSCKSCTCHACKVNGANDLLVVTRSPSSIFDVARSLSSATTHVRALAPALPDQKVESKSEFFVVWGLTMLRAVLGAATISLYYASIANLPLEDAVALFFCSPVFAAVLEWIVFRTQVPNVYSLAGCTATVLGVFLLSQPELFEAMVSKLASIFIASPFSLLNSAPSTTITAAAAAATTLTKLRTFLGAAASASASPFWMLIAALAAITNASSFLVVRQIGNRQSALVLTLCYHGTVVVVAGVALYFGFPSGGYYIPPTFVQARHLAIVALTQFFGQLLLNRGFQLESATRGSAINVLQMLFSYVWDITILKESIVLPSVLGGISVTAGVLLVAASGGSGSKPQDCISEEEKAEIQHVKRQESMIAAGVMPLVMPSRPSMTLPVSVGADSLTEPLLRGGCGGGCECSAMATAVIAAEGGCCGATVVVPGAAPEEKLKEEDEEEEEEEGENCSYV
eukprot:CAMPEP_0175069310 /NCGR_PEP_ID=MMETSP0052_2-20121109/18128_1 /TAXON_ID=51329 ORGANISM="Polytomella parva, Strain SAG 63-3" /NCGR_SAMPLE_ID=MMETSP0052_2 /ASSEMBLY_ACC=CAM_ASM_000194 /LENGTH=523 /DNA_ID=CAMNT_0016336379 /DNA_START=146 /DNA_END=1717 /DNA_ORIENTATION=-